MLQLCQNDVQFQMNLNFVTNFVILNKHFELLNKYLLELVVKWNLFEHNWTEAAKPDFEIESTNGKTYNTINNKKNKHKKINLQKYILKI